MKSKLSVGVFILFTIFVCNITFGQSKRFKKEFEQQQEELKKEFPPPLVILFPKNSLGEKLQTLFEEQARDACGIIRDNKRLYIPKEIVNSYGQEKLKSTLIYDISISATNLLFLALLPSDKSKISNGKFNEQEYISAKRIVGINDELVNFGQSILAPINGFPSLFYQSSCGSYFVGDITTKVKAPVAELEASLEAETKKSTSITTVTGKFFSPLYQIFRQNTAQSVYAHLLLWEIYAEECKTDSTKSEYLFSNGQYISEFNGTITNKANNTDQSISMNGRLSANIAAGIFSAGGNINMGNENKISFYLKDFNTAIHKLTNGNLSWALTDLPKIDAINQKLQNSVIFNDKQPSINGLVTHLLPTEFSRKLIGVPASLCDRESWIIEDGGYDKSIWSNKPNVTSIYTSGKNGELPECVCKISGTLKKTAIDNAIKKSGVLDLDILLVNSMKVKDNRLVLEVHEPFVKVTDEPKILPINGEVVNASRQEIKASNKISYSYPIQLIINSKGVKLIEPFVITNIQIEYLSKDSVYQFLRIHNGLTVNGNSVYLDIRTNEKPQSFVQQGELNIPVKIKFNIELVGGLVTQLVTNTINLNVPNLIEQLEIKSQVLEE